MPARGTPILLGLLISAAAAEPIAARIPEIVIIAPSNPYRRPPVSERELAAMRGGLSLPNGLDVSLGIDIQTRVNDLLVLHTIYASDGPFSGIRVFTDGAAPVRTAPDTQTVTMAGASGTPVIEVTSQPSGTTITPAVRVSSSTVNLVSGPSAIWVGTEGQTEVPVQPNGEAVDAAPGRIALKTDELGSVVTLDAATLQVRHLIGEATGVIIANTANDQLIDTVSSVNVDLQGSTVPMLSSLLTADRVALESMGNR